MKNFLVACKDRYGVTRSNGKRLAALFAITLSLTVFQAKAQAQTVTVAALGDSLTQGYGLQVDDGFTKQLERWLVSNGLDAKVFNAGVSGDTTAGGLSRIEWTLTPDIDAMIVALGGNDLLRGIDPATSRANIRGILEAAQERDIPVLLVGMQAPGNYGADYKEAFDSLFPELSAEFGTLYAEGFLTPLMEAGDFEDVVKTYFQSDGIHPNADGVAIVVEALGPSVATLVRSARPSGPL